jgi:hypothetical protein
MHGQQNIKKSYFSGFVKNVIVFSCTMTPDNYNSCLCFGTFCHSINMRTICTSPEGYVILTVLYIKG